MITQTLLLTLSITHVAALTLIILGAGTLFLGITHLTIAASVAVVFGVCIMGLLLWIVDPIMKEALEAEADLDEFYNDLPQGDSMYILPDDIGRYNNLPK